MAGGAHPVARIRFGNFELQQALGPDGRLDVLHGDERGGAAEIATLGHPRGIKDGDRLAALALDVTLFDLPAALVIGDPAQRRDQIVLDDPAGVGVEFRRRGRAAERADQRLLGRIPDRLRSARGTGEFLSGEFLGHGR